MRLSATMRLRRSDVIARPKLVLAIATGIAACLVPSPARSELVFATPAYYGTGGRPTSVAVGDLTGDQFPEVVATNFDDGTVSIFRNLGNGTYSAGSIVPAGVGAWAVAMGDFNLDNQLDLAVANNGAGTVSILLGNGNGTFQPKVDIPTGAGSGSGPWAIEAMDLNGDGKLDLGVTHANAASVSVLFGNGLGGFTQGPLLGAGAIPTSLTLGDATGEGLPDIVVAGYGSNSVLVFPGNGSGGFGGASVLSGGSYPIAAQLAHFNTDTYPDIAVAGFGTGHARIFAGNGMGGFEPHVDYMVGNGPYSITVGDLDGDGSSDLALADHFSDDISVLLNDSNGLFLPRVSLVAGHEPQMVVAADLNVDGRIDLVVANAGSNSVEALMNEGQIPDRPPVIIAPASISGPVNTTLSFTATVSDPDGDPIESLTASGSAITAGGSFTAASGNGSGTFQWTPGSTQAGTYTVLLSATSACRATGVSGPVECAVGTATTSVFVTTADQPLVIDPIADQTIAEGATRDIPVHAADPDGDAIVLTLTAPSFASLVGIVGSPGSVQATIHLAPGPTAAGTYPTNVLHATAGPSVADEGFAIVVTNANAPPVLTAPTSVFTWEASVVALDVTATDPDGERVALGILNQPIGSTFIDQGTGVGKFNWTPDYAQAGLYNVTFTGRDASGADATPVTVSIMVGNLNRQPSANAGGPYAGTIGVPLTFDGTASADPDGDLLTYHWAFGDLGTGSGPTPQHAYLSGGTFVVTLTVGDGTASAGASATATIQDVFPARAFTTGGNATIRLGSAKATWCVQIEPVGASYLNTAVIGSTISAKWNATTIFALGGKSTVGGDKDANGVQELTACFGKADLRTLFAGLPKGTHVVTMVLEGGLISGGIFHADLTVEVVSSGSSVVASITPNPLVREGWLTVATGRAGWLRASLFDIRGRLVRRVIDHSDLPAGYHDLFLDGRSDRGGWLPSGIYFYRVESAEGVVTGRFALAR